MQTILFGVLILAGTLVNIYSDIEMGMENSKKTAKLERLHLLLVDQFDILNNLIAEMEIYFKYFVYFFNATNPSTFFSDMQMSLMKIFIKLFKPHCNI